MKNSFKSYRQLPGKRSLVQEMADRPSQSAKEGGELKKKFVRLRSIKIADRGSTRSPLKQGKGGISQSGVHAGGQKKNSSERKVKRRSPSYMNPTSSSDRRKEESLQVSTRKQTSHTIQSSIQMSHASKKNGKNMKSLSRLSSLRPRKPSMKTSGVPSYLVPDVTRATCSSTLKDSKFPDYVDLNPGGTESEGTSVMKVCPYTYCSLNGHCHKPSPPLKRFLSARRRSLKAQKSIKMRNAKGCRIKNVIKGKNKADTGVDLMPHLMQEVDVISSPGSLDSWDEQSSELLTGDWDDDFFLEIYANSIPDITDSDIFEEFGVMEHSSLDVPQFTNEKMDKESIDPSIVAYEKVPSGFGQRTETKDYLEETESVVDSSCSEPSLVDVKEDGKQQDQSTDSLFAHEEAISASGATSELIDCIWEEKNPALDENSSSIQTGMTSEICADDFVSNNECDPTSSASEITFMAEAILCDKDIVSYGPEAPIDPSDEIAFPPADDSYVFSENLKIDAVAAPSDETSITKRDGDVIMEVIEINTTGVESIDYNGEIPKSDNVLPGEATPVADSNKTYESNENNDREKILRDSKDVDVAEDRAGLDLRTLEEEISAGSRDDFEAGHGTVAYALNADSAFPEINGEDQRKINDPGDIPEDQVYDSVLVCNVEKDTDLHQCQNVLDGQTFPVRQNSSTTDGENCNKEIDKNQFSQDGNLNNPSVSWNRSITSSEEYVGEKEKQASTVKSASEEGATKQIKHALHQDVEEPLGAKTKHYAKDENAFSIGKIGGPILCRGTSLREITNYEGKEHIENMTKGGKFMMPERVLRLTRSCSVPKQMRGRHKYVVEDKNEGRKFNPRRPRFLPINPDPEREKVNLRHQMMDERKNAEEWMLDYALRKAVSRLATSQRKKVNLLVAAFEAIMPPSKCEARMKHAAISSTHTRSLQACH